MDRCATTRGYGFFHKRLALTGSLPPWRGWFVISKSSPRPNKHQEAKCTPVFIVAGCLLAFALSETGKAGDILRGGVGANGASGPAITNYYGGNAAAISRLDQNAQDILARTTNALQAAQAMQQAARNWAVQGPNNLGANPLNPRIQLPNVPNGLVPSGLQPATGPNAYWLNAAAPSQSVANGWTTVTIQQTASKAILNWQTFNIGKNTTLYFNQSGGNTIGAANTAVDNWVVLNRILDPSGVPSQILGSIKAEGSVYVLNQNGIIFGGSSQVNVASLLASSLNLFDPNITTSNTDFLQYGIGYKSTSTNFPNGILTTQNPKAGPVIVQTGAVINGGNLGLILLAAPRVTNEGSISTTGGQAALIAGIGVDFDYLPDATSNSPAVLIPDEVNFTATPSTSTNILQFFNTGQLVNPKNGADETPVGHLTNTGIIATPKGNISLLGGNIEQDGVLLASTSVKRPGSIYIGAYYEAQPTASVSLTPDLTALTGPIVFGSNAFTAILPDASDGTIPTGAVSKFTPGAMYFQGISVDFQSGSITYAPGQVIGVTIRFNNWVNVANPNTGASRWPSALPPGAGRILLEDGATLDVSGVQDVELPGSTTILGVKLAGNELADSPLQQTGFLLGSTITVDTGITGVRSDGLPWVGTPLADLSGYVNLIPQPIGQVLTTGGTISLGGNEIDLASGSTINLAGGYVHYLGGVVVTTRLIDATGHMVDIANADPNDVFTGFAGQFTVHHPHWGVTENYMAPMMSGAHYVPDYIVGSSAGALDITVSRDTGLQTSNSSAEAFIPNGGALVMDATVIADTYPGIRQATSGNLPVNGSLSILTDFSVEIGDPAVLSAASAVAATLPPGFSMISPYLASWPKRHTPPGLFGTNGAPAYSPRKTPWNNPYLNANVITSTELDASDYSSISIVSKLGQIVEDSGTQLSVQPGGAISLTAGYVTIGGSLVARSGAINLNASYETSTEPTAYLPAVAEISHSIIVDPTAVLDVSGLFVDDSAGTENGPADLNGGAISLVIGADETANKAGKSIDTTGNIVLSPGSILDLMGGGRVLPNGRLQTQNGVPLGAGGNLELEIYSAGQATETAKPTRARLEVGSTINALGFSGGGTVTLEALGIQVGGDPAPSLRPTYSFYFDPAYWGTLGFASFDLLASYDAVIPVGASIVLQHDNLIPNQNITKAPTGANLALYSTVSLLPIGLRSPTNLSVTAGQQHTWNDGMTIPNANYLGVAHYLSGGGADTKALSLDEAILAPETRITADPGASVSIASIGQVDIYGDIIAPSGTVSIKSSGSITVKSPNVVGGLCLAPGTVLDVAGATIINPLTTPIRTPDGSLFTPYEGIVLPGGTVNLTDDDAPIVVARGALIDVSGASANLDVAYQVSYGDELRQVTDVVFQLQPTWSNAGQVNLTGSAGLLFDGTLVGRGGNPLANGATLTITQEGNDNLPPPNSQPLFFSVLLVQNSESAGLGPTFIPKRYRPGGKVELRASDGSTGNMIFGVDSLNGSGFANLLLGATSPEELDLVYSGKVTLTLPGSFIAQDLSEMPTGNYATTGIIALPSKDLNPSAALTSNRDNGSLSVTASYIELSGFFSGNPNGAPHLTYADGRLNLQGRAIDLVGSIYLANIAQATFVSDGDLRLMPYIQPDSFYQSNGGTGSGGSPYGILGELVSGGNLTLDAERIYAPTASTFVIEATPAGTYQSGPHKGQLIPTTITFGYPRGKGPNTATPLSAGATLIVDASAIEQGGNLSLPFGTIILGDSNATPGGTPTATQLENLLAAGSGAAFYLPTPVITNSLVLSPGGITSVSGNGAVIPYGSTQDATTWIYDPLLNTPNYLQAGSPWSTALAAPPAKLITLLGTSIAIQKGASVNLSGGGDLQASEWVPGTGGSRDVLTASNVTYTNGTASPTLTSLYPDDRSVYAILPGYSSSTAPYDPAVDQDLPNSQTGLGNAVGQSVYLSGVPGLPAGVYTLLPGAYATLPGAYRVVQVTGVSNPLASQLLTLPDGTAQTSGYFVNQLTGVRNSGLAEFQVQSSSVWTRYSQFTISSANAFFPGYSAKNGAITPFLPNDAGHLVLGDSTTATMTLAGNMLTAPAPNGLGSEIDIVSQNIEVVASTSQATQPGYLALTAAELDNLNAGSLLIGGIRSFGAKGVTITPQATNILIANDSSSPLYAPEIFLVALPVLVPVQLTLDNAMDNYSNGQGYSIGSGTNTPDTVTVFVPETGTGLVTLESGSLIKAVGQVESSRSLPVLLGTPLTGTPTTNLPNLPAGVTVSVIQKVWSGGNPVLQYYQQLDQDLASLVQISNGTAATVYLPTLAQLTPAPITVTDDIINGNPFFPGQSVPPLILKLPSLAAGANVMIEAGATINGGNTLLLAGAGDTKVALGANLSARNLTIASSQITFANLGASGLPPTGAAFDPATLAALQAQQVSFESASTINFLGNINLVLAAGTLDLSAGAFTTTTGSAVSVSAPAIALTNNLNAPTAINKTLPATGSLTLNAGEIDFGNGNRALYGFGSFAGKATGAILGQSSGSFNFGATPVTLNTPIVIADSNSSQTLQTTSQVTINAIHGQPAALSPVGGQITIIAASITDNAPILAPAGNVDLEATIGNVSLNAGTSINVAGVPKQFYDVTEYAPGGAINLQADSGSVLIATGVILNFSGASGGGNAGSLSLVAPTSGKTVTSAATLLGQATAGYQGGSVTLDSGGAQDLTGLAAQLKLGGVTGNIIVHTRTGDLVLSSTLTGSNVSLTADGGAIQIVTGAVINASGTTGGEIDLYGKTGVDVEGALLATASDPNERGGTVNIGTIATSVSGTNSTYGYENVLTSGAITIGPNAIINVSGGSLGGWTGGKVYLRAPLLARGGVNVSVSPSATIAGDSANGTILEIYATWNTTDNTKGALHFDGIIDPAGWYNDAVSGQGAPSLVAGAFTDQNGNPVPYSQGHVFIDLFTPTSPNPDHVNFYEQTLANFVQHFNLSVPGVQVRPGVELVNGGSSVNNGNISVLTDWNLGQGTGSYNPATGTYSSFTGVFRNLATGLPGVLTLRASNNVVIQAGISDGFYNFGYIGPTKDLLNYALITYQQQVWIDYNIALNNYQINPGQYNNVPPVPPSFPNPTTTPPLPAANDLFTVLPGPQDLIGQSQMPVSWGQSWSYRVVGGADLNSANPLSVLPESTFNNQTQNAGSVILTGHHLYSYYETYSDAGVPFGTPIFTNDVTYFGYGVSGAYLGLSVNPTVVPEPAMLRTGTGFIDVAAAINVALTDPRNPDPLGPGDIYTAGQPVTTAPHSAPYTMAYAPLVDGGSASWLPLGFGALLSAVTNPQGGGDISITAQNDIIGAENATNTLANVSGTGVSGQLGAYIGQFWGPWLTAPLQTAPVVPWYVSFGAFDQGVMSIGGNVTVKAGADIQDLSVSLPTTAYLDAARTTLTMTGGGILTVQAGGNIYSGDFLVGQGSGTITAGSAIVSDFTYYSPQAPTFPNPVATLLAVQNGAMVVTARQSIDIGGIYDPTDIGTSVPGGVGNRAFGLQIVSMTALSSVSVQSAAGSLTLNSLVPQIDLFSWGTQLSPGGSPPTGVSTILLPATLNLLAFDGPITIDHGGGLVPSPTGNLTLIADQDITLLLGQGQLPTGNIPANELSLLDYPLNTGILPSAFDPVIVTAFGVQGAPGLSPTQLHDSKLLHTGDTQPVRIYSLTGDILDGKVAPDGTGNDELAVVPDKPAQIYAQGDIVDLAFYGQNLTKADITRITAGGNIIDLPVSQSLADVTPPILALAGPGYFDIEAGGDITLTSQRALIYNFVTGGGNQVAPETGILTVGNSVDTTAANWVDEFGDPYLPHGGAAVTVLFGVRPGVDYTAFEANYLNPATSASAPYLGFFTTAVDQYETAIGNNADGQLTPAQAWSIFQKLPSNRQQLLVDQIFFAVLNQVGLDYNNTKSTYYQNWERGYEAINALFPASLGYTANNLTGGTNGANSLVSTGTLDLRGSTIQTDQGGSIDLLGPGGSIIAGTQAPPPPFISQSEEGILTLEQGDINTFTDVSVDVAQSRVMTEQGGAIAMWSSNGNLDAGKGAKTNLSFPLPAFIDDNDLYTVVDIRGEVAGAGIATLQSIPNAPTGNINLMAPRGTVNAGAAGITASGNINIAAFKVVNAFNIQAQGTVTGIPTIAAPNVNALTSANTASGAVTDQMNEVAKQAEKNTAPTEMQSVIIVEVLGYGGSE